MTDEIKYLSDKLIAQNNNSPITDKNGVASILNCSVSTINRNLQINRNIPDHIKLSGKVYFDLVSVAKFIVTSRIKSYH